MHQSRENHRQYYKLQPRPDSTFERIIPQLQHFNLHSLRQLSQGKITRNERTQIKRILKERSTSDFADTIGEVLIALPSQATAHTWIKDGLVEHLFQEYYLPAKHMLTAAGRAGLLAYLSRPVSRIPDLIFCDLSALWIHCGAPPAPTRIYLHSHQAHGSRYAQVKVKQHHLADKTTISLGGQQVLTPDAAALDALLYGNDENQILKLLQRMLAIGYFTSADLANMVETIQVSAARKDKASQRIAKLNKLPINLLL